MRILFRVSVVLSGLLVLHAGRAQQKPTAAAAPWWGLTTALANDGMEGRDTGSAAYERAAEFVAAKFKADGLKPAGVDGTWFQPVPMHEVDLDTEHSSVELMAAGKPAGALKLLYETTLAPHAGLAPVTEGQLVFIGYGVPPADLEVRGKVVVFFSGMPGSLSAEQRARFNGERVLSIAKLGAVGAISIDNPAAIEPTHWPAAYARTVTLREEGAAAKAPGFVGLRVSAEAAPKLFAGSAVDPAKLLADAEKGLPLPAMALAHGIRISVRMTEKDIVSPNVLAVLPGSDPQLGAEYVALSAHLDGYGYGTPVNGDSLYNGALDDAAYVATLLEFAHKQAAHPARRSLLFCIFTGEEKGLLGSVYFATHPTMPAARIKADLNLDQLRPIFPLRILTMEGIGDSTLGDTAREVAERFRIELRPDREPERNLFRRADNYSFVKIGVPIASFIFGYDPASPEEHIYRDWYARRYHKPQDDLATPIDWEAAVRFNDFYRELALTVANAPDAPRWRASSPNAPRASH